MGFIIPIWIPIILGFAFWAIVLHSYWQPVIIRIRKAIRNAIIVRNSRRGIRIIRIR